MFGIPIAAVTIAVAVSVMAIAPGTAPPPDLQVRELNVTTADGQVLPATLRIPAKAQAGRPAMVLVHGAGDGPRANLADEAEAFTRSGVATLTYDKRTAGYALTQRSYSQLADDAVAAAAVLRAQPGIDPAAVGLWGISEGGWVAPLAATRDPRTAFLVVVGANGGSPLAQQVWSERIKIEQAGVHGSLVDAYAATAYRLINGLGMFPEAYHDAAAPLRTLTLPVLGVWGDRDPQTPPVESVSAYRALLDAAGNQHYTLRTIAGAEHTVRTTTTGWDRGTSFAPGYVDLIGSWTAQVASGHAPPTSVQGTGFQSRTTAPAPPLAWYESVPVQVAGFAVLVIGFAGFGIVAALRRFRGPRSPWSARLLAATGLLVTLGWPVYLGDLLANSGGTVTTNGVINAGPLVAGRPLLWLGLQALAAVATVAGVVTAIRHRPAAGDRLRTGALLGTGAVFVVWASYWGLLLP